MATEPEAKDQPPKMRYFEAKNCNRKIRADDLEFLFDPYAHVGGTWWGIYTTNVQRELDALDALIKKDKRCGVKEITKEEFDVALQKKTREISDTYSPLVENPTARPVSMAEKVAVVVESGSPDRIDPRPEEEEPAEESTPPIPQIDEVESVIKVGDVAPAQSTPAAAQTKGKRKSKDK